MKNFNLITLIVLVISFSSCSNDDDNTPTPLAIETNTITNLFAPQQGGIDPNTGQPLPVSGAFTKFDFNLGPSTQSSVV